MYVGHRVRTMHLSRESLISCETDGLSLTAAIIATAWMCEHWRGREMVEREREREREGGGGERKGREGWMEREREKGREGVGGGRERGRRREGEN